MTTEAELKRQIFELKSRIANSAVPMVKELMEKKLVEKEKELADLSKGSKKEAKPKPKKSSTEKESKKGVEVEKSDKFKIGDEVSLGIIEKIYKLHPSFKQGKFQYEIAGKYYHEKFVKKSKPKTEKHFAMKSDKMTIGGKEYNLNVGDECKAAIKALVALKEQRNSSSADAKAKPVSEKIGHAVEVLTNHALDNVAKKIEDSPAQLKSAANQLERAIKALSAALVKITGSKGLPKQIEDSLKAIADYVKENSK